MRLRQRLAWRYAMVVGVCLLLLAGLAHHEFVVEPAVRRELGQVKPSGSSWGEVAEMVFHALIPVVLTGGWWFMRRILTPLDVLADGVARIDANRLQEPLPRSNNGDEVDRLTEAFNATTARLHRSFQQVREFTLHASHELKTPLTVMRAQIETALRDAEDLSDSQREWMESHLDEIQRLAGLVDALTLLAKADAGVLPIDRQPVALDELVRELNEDALILAEPGGIQVVLRSCEPAVVLGDRHRLRQLLLNLADNAVKYNVAGGSIALALENTGDTARFTIANTGAPVPPELCARVFDRFVRGRPPRQGRVEGSGLGLTICHWIVQVHHGRIQFSSSPDGLTTVQVTLPIHR